MSPLLLFALVMGVLGLAIGSFLNVVIYRVPRSESVVSPPSHCPRCDTPIKGRHNVPVLSWLVLRGRCASCRVPISARYPLVEAATGLLFVVVTLRLGVTATLPAFLYLAAIAVALAMIDFDVRRLPDSIVLPSYAVAIALLVPVGALDSSWHDAVRAGVATVALLALLGLFALAFPHGLDTGVVKLGGLLGLYLAWLSWPTFFLGVLATGVIATGAAASRALLRRTAPDGAVTPTAAAVPLATCLITATVLSVLVAAPVTAWCDALLAA